MDIFGIISVPTWFIFVGSIVLLLYLYTKWCQSIWSKLGIPGPKPVPFFGIMHRYLKEGLHEVDKDLYKKYGRVVGVYHGNIPLLLINDAELIKQVMVKEFSNFTNRFEYLYAGDVVESALLDSRDEHWKFLRRTLSPTFSTGKLKNMMPLLQNNINTLIRVINEKSKKGESLEMRSLFGAYTIDNIASTAFGLEIDSQKNPNDPFVKHAKMLFSWTFADFVMIFVCMFPVLSRIFKYMRVEFSPKAMITFFGNVTAKAVEMRKSDNGVHRDFLQLMLNVHKERTDIGDQKTRGLTRTEIHGNTIVFMVAGYETTKITLTFAAYTLATNPDVQDKLIQEIDRELADQELGYENVMNLEYLDMFLSEVLRLWGPAPRINRVAATDITLNGIQIPRGADVTISPVVVHRDPEYWPNPDKFEPERFTKENNEKRSPYVFLPFGVGPRHCIGMRLALLEAKLAIVAILQKFRFETTPDTEIPPKIKNAVLLNAENDVILKLKAR